MSRRESDEYNFVGLARSPAAKHGATPAAAGFGYCTSTVNSKSYGDRYSTCSTAPTERISTGSKSIGCSSRDGRRALQPMNINSEFDSFVQQTPAACMSSSVSMSSWKGTAPHAPESANRSTLLMSRALRLSPATENKATLSTIGDSPQPRPPLFHGDSSPVLSQAGTVISTLARPTASAELESLEQDMLSPVQPSSRRSPVPAFTPGFEDDADACSIQQQETPQIPDPYLSSKSRDVLEESIPGGSSDDGQWSEFSSSVNGATFSPNPPTPMPATARRAAKKMALLSKQNRAAGADAVGASATPSRATVDPSSPVEWMTGNTPAAVSALLQMAGNGMRNRSNQCVHDVSREVSGVDLGSGAAAADGEMDDTKEFLEDVRARMEEDEQACEKVAALAGLQSQRYRAAPKSPTRTAGINPRRPVMTPRRPTAAAALLEMSQGTPRRLIMGLIDGAGAEIGVGVVASKPTSHRKRFVPHVARVAENVEEETPRRFIMGIVDDQQPLRETTTKKDPSMSVEVLPSSNSAAAAAAAAAAARTVAARAVASTPTTGDVGNPDTAVAQRVVAPLREESTPVASRDGPEAALAPRGSVTFKFSPALVGTAVLKTIVILNYFVISCGAVFVAVLLACLMCAEPKRAVPIY